MFRPLVEYSGSISATGKYNYFSSYFHNNYSLGRPYYQFSLLDQVTGYQSLKLHERSQIKLQNMYNVITVYQAADVCGFTLRHGLLNPKGRPPKTPWRLFEWQGQSPVARSLRTVRISEHSGDSLHLAVCYSIYNCVNNLGACYYYQQIAQIIILMEYAQSHHVEYTVQSR